MKKTAKEIYESLSKEFVRRGIGSLDFSKLNELYTWAEIGENAKSEYDKIQDLEAKLHKADSIWQAQEKKIDELKKLFKDQGGCIVSAMSLLNKIQDLENKLELERKATKGFCEALDRERLAHGKTQAKLGKAVEAFKYIEKGEPEKMRLKAREMVKALEQGE